MRPLLAARGFAVPGEPHVRLHTLADVFAYAGAKGVELRLDGTEVKVRRPKANHPGRRAFVSGKLRQNTKKATVISDEAGRTLWTGGVAEVVGLGVGQEGTGRWKPTPRQRASIRLQQYLSRRSAEFVPTARRWPGCRSAACVTRREPEFACSAPPPHPPAPLS